MAQRLLVLTVDAPVDIPAHALLHHQFAGKEVLQDPVGTLMDAQRAAQAGGQIEIAHQIVVHAQGLDQFSLAALQLDPLLLLLQLLGRIVQQEPLEEQHAVLLHQLEVAQDMDDLPVAVLDPILHTGAVPHLLQALDDLLDDLLVLVHH